MSFFNKKQSSHEPRLEGVDSDGIFDVDAVFHRGKSPISPSYPGSAEGWRKKLENEDEHMRKLS